MKLTGCLVRKTLQVTGRGPARYQPVWSGSYGSAADSVMCAAISPKSRRPGLHPARTNLEKAFHRKDAKEKENKFTSLVIKITNSQCNGLLSLNAVNVELAQSPQRHRSGILKQQSAAIDESRAWRPDRAQGLDRRHQIVERPIRVFLAAYRGIWACFGGEGRFSRFLVGFHRAVTRVRKGKNTRVPVPCPAWRD